MYSYSHIFEVFVFEDTFIVFTPPSLDRLNLSDNYPEMFTTVTREARNPTVRGPEPFLGTSLASPWCR